MAEIKDLQSTGDVSLFSQRLKLCVLSVTLNCVRVEPCPVVSGSIYNQMDNKVIRKCMYVCVTKSPPFVSINPSNKTIEEEGESSKSPVHQPNNRLL